MKRYTQHKLCQKVHDLEFSKEVEKEIKTETYLKHLKWIYTFKPRDFILMLFETFTNVCWTNFQTLNKRIVLVETHKLTISLIITLLKHSVNPQWTFGRELHARLFVVVAYFEYSWHVRKNKGFESFSLPMRRRVVLIWTFSYRVVHQRGKL